MDDTSDIAGGGRKRREVAFRTGKAAVQRKLGLSLPSLQLASTGTKAQELARGGFLVARDVWPAWVLASFLILRGFSWGLPAHPFVAVSWQADENAAVWAVQQIHFPTFYPPWLPWGTAMFYETWILKEIVSLGGLFTLGNRDVLVLGRIVVYLSALGAIAAVYVLGRDLFGRYAGIVAALALSVSAGFAYTAHLFKVEAVMIVWLVLALWKAQRLTVSGRIRDAVLAGVFAGLATSTQYSAATLVPAGLVAIRVAPLHNRGRALKLYLACTVGAFLVGTPYALLYPPRLISGLRMDFDINRTGIAYTAARPPALVDYVIHVLPYSLSVPLLAAGGAGLVLAAFSLRSRLLPLWTFLAAYALLLAPDNSRLVRATLPLVAVAALFVGYLVTALARMHVPRLVVSLGVIALVGYGFLFSLSVTQVFTRPDPRVQASRWLRANVPLGTPIATASRYFLTVPQLQHIGYRDIEIGRHGELRPADSRYLILSDTNLLPWEEAIGHYPAVRRFITRVESRYCLLAQFENSQKVLWINSKPRTGSIPFDLLDANPRISILALRKPAERCSRFLPDF